MLDLVAVREGFDTTHALRTAIEAARHVEALGFQRVWLAEHHNMIGVASSAPAVLVGAVAAATSTIRVGSGEVMLPNHAPLVVAEAFGTLAELYPDRIDLGIGRAPGTDPLTMRALRRDRHEGPQDFEQDLAELHHYLQAAEPGQRIVAHPGAGTQVPIWLLGSSLFSAQLAAQRGLPYAFASHFAPRLLLQALEVYRNGFKPSPTCPRPMVAVGVPLVAAESDDQAEFLATSVQQRVLGILTGRRGKLPKPLKGFMNSLPVEARSAIDDFLGMAVIGGPERVSERLAEIANATQADELMLVCDIHDAKLRLKSLELAAQASEALRDPALHP
jgi:luciferase family oxidoreductase group 1